jgi:hypothetical protein
LSSEGSTVRLFNRSTQIQSTSVNPQWKLATTVPVQSKSSRCLFPQISQVPQPRSINKQDLSPITRSRFQTSKGNEPPEKSPRFESTAAIGGNHHQRSRDRGRAKGEWWRSPRVSWYLNSRSLPLFPSILPPPLDWVSFLAVPLFFPRLLLILILRRACARVG